MPRGSGPCGPRGRVGSRAARRRLSGAGLAVCGGRALKRLIVNADDLGRTPGVNQGVERAHRDGIVTSASVMVNHTAASGVAALSHRCPGLGVGLHLALTGGPPALPPERIPSLVGGDGLLHRSPEAGLAAGDPAEVLAEARAQLARFRERVGRAPTHLDFHHHADRLEVVTAAAIALAREQGLPVRSGSAAQRERLRREGVPTADAFVAEFYGDGADRETLVRVILSLPEGISELMCHPGEVDDELRAGSRYAERRADELAALTSPEVRRAVERADVRLVHYGVI